MAKPAQGAARNVRTALIIRPHSPQPRAHSPYDPARHRTPTAATQTTRRAAPLVLPDPKHEDRADHPDRRPALPSTLEAQAPTRSCLFPLRPSQSATPGQLLAMFGTTVWGRWAIGCGPAAKKVRPKAHFPGASGLRTSRTRCPCLLHRRVRFLRPARRRRRCTSGERRLCGCSGS